MPHLQFEVNQKLENKIKDKFANEIQDCYSEIMDTDTDHIAISIREYDKYNLTIGRANPEDDICLMNLDIREGRTIEKRRELALKYMNIVNTNFNIEAKNQYITFTQHPGEDFHLVEKYLARIFHELHAPSLDLCFHKKFFSVGRNRGYAAPSQNPL